MDAKMPTPIMIIRKSRIVEHPPKPMSVTTYKGFEDTAQAPIVLVIFWRRGCWSCDVMVPILKDIARKRPDVQFRMEGSETAKKLHGIENCPTFMVMSRGEERSRREGVATEERFLAWLDETMSAANG